MTVRRLRFLLMSSALSLLFVSPTLADELPVFYQGVRPLGMGGAFTAVADDENAMFYNPAGLNNIKGFGGIEIFNPLFEVNENTVNFIRDFQSMLNKPEAEQTDAAAKLLKDWLGERFRFRTGVFPNITFHNFGIGVLGQVALNGAVHNPLSSNTLELHGRADVALLVSGAYSFTVMNGPLQIGATGKGILRKAVNLTYTTCQLVSFGGDTSTLPNQPSCKVDLEKDLKDLQNLRENIGYGLDLGAIYSLPVFLDPSFGLSILNVGVTDLGSAGQPGTDLGKASKLEQQINLGTALHPPVGFGKLVVALDFIDVTRKLGDDNDLAKRLNAGVEYRLPIILALRAGLHQGYASYGLTADLWILKLAYAYYIEEIGAAAGQVPDGRHLVQLSMGF